MPVITSQFRAPFLLRNRHVQTILGAVLRHGKRLAFTGERLELPDGDFLDLCWHRQPHHQLAILSHGLEGSANQGYVQGMARALVDHGWDALAWNFRGCSEEQNRLVRLYHSGATEDLRAVIDHASQQYSRIALIGFSLGGNLTLKYLGEAPPHPAVIAGVAVSAPIDLASSARNLDTRWSNRIYLRRFIRSLIAKVEAKALRFPGEIDARGSGALRTFLEFDDRYTSRLHGFRDAADYWARASALPYLHQINVPALLLSAQDDPFLAPKCFPFTQAEQNPWLHLEAPATGGHLGFLEINLRPWFERRIWEFLAGNG